MRAITRGLSFIAIALFACCALAQDGASPERGYKLFMEKMCFTCHGTVGQGGERGTGPRIAPNEWPYEAFAQQVRHPRAEMPRYSAKYLEDRELADIQAYLKSIKASRPAREIELLSKAP
jgi:mono/diheme cytochrome c family protein